MGFVKFNIGKVYAVTAPSTSADSLSVVIGDRTFTTAFDTNAATTVDNFITAHGRELNSLGILARDGGNDVDLHGILDGRKFYSANTYTITDNSASYTISADNMSLAQSAADTSIWTMTGYVDGTTSVTATVRYFDEASASQDADRISHDLSSNQGKVGSVKVGTASYATFA